jgi:hypothetical protein
MWKPLRGIGANWRFTLLTIPRISCGIRQGREAGAKEEPARTAEIHRECDRNSLRFQARPFTSGTWRQVLGSYPVWSVQETG